MRDASLSTGAGTTPSVRRWWFGAFLLRPGDPRTRTVIGLQGLALLMEWTSASCVSAPTLESDHPLRRSGLGRRTWPFATALGLGFASLPFARIVDHVLVAGAAALVTVLVLAVALVPWERLPRSLATIPPAAVVLLVFLLREGTGGLRDPVDYEALLLLPVLWLALYGSSLELVLAISLAAATFAGSFALSGAGRSEGEWIKAALWPAVAALVGLRVQALVREVTRLSVVDPLTGVANRARWNEEFARESARVRRSGGQLAVALVDLDHFKRLNDEDGHAAGDRLLRASAEAWAAALRTGDLIARYGGEEFALLLPQTSLEDALRVVERIRAATPAPVTCSVGVAAFDKSEGPGELLARADAALYRAKRGGRNRVEGSEPPSESRRLAD
jgi:diguanylate cyclase (GGDEF)-like protein